MATDDFDDPGFARELDRACGRFEREWKAGQHPKIEDYLSSASPADAPAFLRQLLLIEWEFRAASIQDLDLSKYKNRFPGRETLLEDAWAECRQQVATGER